MKTIGFPKATKVGEKRLAILPEDLKNIKHTANIYIEKDYGSESGIADSAYQVYGCNIVDRKQTLACDVICDPKIGDATYLDELKDGTTIFGWIHAVQNPDIANLLVNKKIDSYAWEDMHEDNKHSFYKNNELAGMAAVIHALLNHGTSAQNAKVAILGNGNAAHGAYQMLSKFGADITLYNRRQEELFKKNLFDYDILVNAILWDTKRTDHIIYEEDLKKMKNHTLIIDISCDRNGGLETSIPTLIDNPTYEKHGVIHYVVENTPSLLYRDASKAISEVVSKCIDGFITGEIDKVVDDACIIKDGQVVDQRIIEFQKLHNLI